MRDDEPEEAEDEDGFDAEVEAVEDLFEAGVGIELGAELHADIGKHIAPRPRADESVEMKAELVHLRDTGGKGDEGPDDGKHASDEDGDRAKASEEVVDEVEVAAAEEQIAAVALDHRTASASADPVGGDRAEVRGQRGHGRQDDELDLSVGQSVAGQRHDDFRWNRNAGGLDGHEQDDAQVATAGNGADEKGDDFF